MPSILTSLRADDLLGKFIFLIKYLAFITLFSFLLGEAGLWIWFPISENSLAVSRKYHLNLPGLKNDILYTRNQYGFRSLSMQTKEKDPRTIRIICLGGSTTDQATQNTEDTWFGILDQKLNEALSKENIRIEVAAWGRSGIGIWDGCRYCRGQLSEFKPDIVITLWGINDLIHNGGPNFLYEGRKRRIAKLRNTLLKKQTDSTTLISKLKATVSKYSQIYRRLTALRNQKHDKISLIIKKTFLGSSDRITLAAKSAYRKFPLREKISSDPDPVLEFRDGFEELILCLKEQGAETLVLGQPVLWKQNMPPAEKSVLWFSINTKEGPVRAGDLWLENQMSRYNQAQEGLVKLTHLAYVPLERLIPKTLDFFYDDCHFTDKGNRAVAEAAYPEVLKLLQKVSKKRKLAA